MKKLGTIDGGQESSRQFYFAPDLHPVVYQEFVSPLTFTNNSPQAQQVRSTKFGRTRLHFLLPSSVIVLKIVVNMTDGVTDQGRKGSVFNRNFGFVVHFHRHDFRYSAVSTRSLVALWCTVGNRVQDGL
jgi:hypothetical protein